MAPWVSFSGKDCSGCKHLNDRGYCEFTACIIPCTVRATIPEAKPITNGDKIRSMTDEELADFLYATWKEQDPFSKEVCGKCGDTDVGCSPKCWLNWLREKDE